MKKTIGILGGMALVALLAGCTQTSTTPATTGTSDTTGTGPAMNQEAPTPDQAQAGVTLHDGANTLDNVPADQIVDLSASTDAVKEVTMTSSFGPDLGMAHPHFSIKQITVKKGDQVKLNVTNTGGRHNLNIDEFNVHLDTPMGQQVSTTFTADKTGTFTYYCSSPGHRGNGHWGVLNVVE